MINYDLSKAIKISENFKRINIHPKNIVTSDCVVRAFALASDTTYSDIRKALNKFKRDERYSSYKVTPCIISFIQKYLKGEKYSFPAHSGEPRMNGISFCRIFTKGTFILNMAHHISCCIDGIIYDTWDCSRKCIYNAYKLK